MNTKYADLKLLSDTICLINKSKNFQTTADVIFSFIRSFIDFNMAVIYRINESEEKLEIISCLGTDAIKLKKRIPFKIGEGAVGLVAKDKRPILIKDVLKNGEIQVRQNYAEDPLIRTFLAAPLIVGDRVIGILSISNSKPNQYDDYDVQMINIIASQGAVLLELNNNIIETQRFSNKILENINNGIIVLDINGKLIRLNRYSEKLFGFSFEEMAEIKRIDRHLILDNGENFINKCFLEKKIYFEEPGLLIRKDEDLRRIRLSTSLMNDEEGKIKNCICIFRDNTEIENLQNRVAMSDKLEALGRVTAGLVHEIRNPLLPIRNASEYLLQKYSGSMNNDEINRLLKIISEESERLNRVLDGFISTGKDSFSSIGNCSLIEVISEVLTLLKYTLSKNNIDAVVKFEKDVIIPCSKDNLKQVFINLALNAIDSIVANDGSKTRHIEFDMVVDADNATITIEDTGAGIKKKNMHQIFDPFYSTKQHGSGMGLYVAFNIIRGSGGAIDVEKSNEEGTKIVLTMPLKGRRVYEY